MVGLGTSKSLLNLTSRVIAALPLYQEIEKTSMSESND